MTSETQDNPQEAPDPFKDFITEAVSDGEVVFEQNQPDPADKPRDWDQFDNDGDDDDPADTEDGDDADDDGDDEGADDIDNDASDDDDGDDEPKPKKRRKGARARIAELTAARRQAEERATAAEEALKAKDTPAAKEDTKPDTPLEVDTSDLTLPKAIDFDFGELDAGYMEQMAEYKAEVAFRRREAKAEVSRAETAAETTRQEAAATLEKNFLDNVVNPGKDLYDDFDDVVIEGGKAGDYQLTPTLVNLIAESDAGAKIMYHFASNPEESEKVANMSVERQAAYFGRMEARYSPSDEDARKSRRTKASKAPKPPRAKSRGKGSGKKDNAATSDFSAFERMVNSKG